MSGTTGTTGTTGAAGTTGTSGGATGGTTFGGEAGKRGGSTVDEVKQEARQYAEKMTGRAKEQGRSIFEQQKESAATQVESVAHAFRNTAGQMQGDGQQTGHYVEMAADRLESLGRVLRQKDVDTLITDAENLGRRAPAAFFAGSVVAGFLFARFLKSSAERRNASLAEPYEGRDPASPQGTNLRGTERNAPGESTSGVTGTRASAGIDIGEPSATAKLPTSTTESKPGGNSYGNR